MSEADLNVLKSAIKLVESKVSRDFNEIRNLQNSSSVNGFVNKAVNYVQNTLFEYLKGKRPTYSIYVKNGDDKIEKNSKFSIYVNAIMGMKNLSHGIPYFCTTLSVAENGKIFTGLVNNYVENEMFFVSRGSGAFVNNQKMRVSSRTDIGDLLIAVKSDTERTMLKRILPKLPMFKMNNCSVLDACYTSCGRYDANIVLDGNIKDVELSKLFIEESGGLAYNITDTSLIFSNGNVVDKLKLMFEQK
ncbi:MAG: inositol monophosphatase family protein [Rickettsiales bacterium]|nr:inositol monophosphatase family protein [Rickettsiales bacterium]